MHRCPGPLSPVRARRLRAAALSLGLLGCIIPCCLPAGAADNVDDATRQVLIAAVEAASAVDSYHARCRGDVSGRRMENLNKLLVGKLRITVLTVEDDLFPERDYRRAQQRLEQDFSAALRAAGGCRGAKESGLPETLKARYDAGLDAIRALP